VSNNYNLSIRPAFDEIKGVGWLAETDTLEMIRNANLSEKEKIFMGGPGAPVINENFGNVAHNAVPDVAVWTVIEDNDATVKVSIGAIVACIITAGTVAANDAVAHTQGKMTWRIGERVYNSLHWKSKFNVNDLTGEFGIGFVWHASEADGFNFGTLSVACLYGNNDVVNAVSDDGAVAERTDVSAYINEGINVTVEVILTSTDVKFYIDGTLRATHTNRVPEIDSVFCMATRNSNGVQTILINHWVEVWPE